MNPNGNPLVQEVGLDLDTCLKTGRAVWTFGHTPYRIYPINTRSRREKRKTKCILQLVRRLSLLHREYVPIKKYVQLAACYRTLSSGYPDARHFFLGRLNAARNRLSDLPKDSIAFSTPVIPVGKTEITTKAGCLRSKLLKSFLRYLQNIFAL